jgi:hypothetical protein
MPLSGEISVHARLFNGVALRTLGIPLIGFSGIEMIIVSNSDDIGIEKSRHQKISALEAMAILVHCGSNTASRSQI